MHLEIAVENLDDALSAQKGGADSVELSIDLSRDGLTPPQALVKQLRDALSIELHVIVRPHDRDFVYSLDEMDTILQTTANFVQIGVDGIVFGAHLPDGRLDVDAIQQVRETSGVTIFTLHRALDTCTNPDEALRNLSGIIDRVLTAGQAPTAWDGRDDLKRWQTRFGDTMQFVGAGTIRESHLLDLLNWTGLQAVHVGSAVREEGVVSVDKTRHLRQLLDDIASKA